MKAELLIDERHALDVRSFVEIVVWRLPRAAPGSEASQATVIDTPGKAGYSQSGRLCKPSRAPVPPEPFSFAIVRYRTDINNLSTKGIKVSDRYLHPDINPTERAKLDENAIAEIRTKVRAAHEATAEPEAASPSTFTPARE